MNKKILIVDDDRSTSTLLQTLLQIEGYASVICPRPENVLSTLKEQQADLVLMDLHLAEVDSLGVLRAIRADAEVGQVPVVMVSGMDRSYECLKAGASDFILKPFRPADLLATITKHLTPRK